MQSRSKWLVAVGAVVIVAAGIAFLWWRTGSASALPWWRHHGATVLQYGLPPLIALVGWTGQQLMSPRLERSTPEELVQALQALARRGLEWWRGVPEPAWPGHVLRAGLRPLDVWWARHGGPAADRHVYGRTSQIPSMAARFRDTRYCRLIICGEAGSGKSVLARLLMAELLKNRGRGEPVPVFLPLWSWDPDTEDLHDWLKRRIGEEYPELLAESAYGPTAVAALVDQGLVLPILDGLDALPERCRMSVLSDGGLRSQDRLILTCRTDVVEAFKNAAEDQAGEIEGFTVIEPGPVRYEEAERFLSDVTGRSAAWKAVQNHIADCDDCQLKEVLSEPRICYLASIVFGTSDKVLAQVAAAALIAHHADPAGAIGSLLLSELIPALVADGGGARGFPWYEARAQAWLTSLAWRDLRDPADRADPDKPDRPDRPEPENRPDRPEPEPENRPDPRADPGNSRIAWWNLHRAIALLCNQQAWLRGLVAGGIAFGVITSIYKLHHLYHHVNDGGWTYSLLTAGAYGIMIFIACAFLGSAAAGEPRIPPPRDSQRKAILWWSIRYAWVHWRRIVLAGGISFVLFGFLIGLRVALPNLTHAGIWTGIRTGFYDGIMQGGLIVVITFLVAGVPAPPRTVRASDFGSPDRSEIRAFLTALVLGVGFGVLWGVSVVLRAQKKPVPSYGVAIPAALITQHHGL